MRRFAILALAVTLLASTGCDRRESVSVDLEKRQEVSTAASPAPNSVRVAVGGMITPKEGFAYYKGFLDYLGEKLGRPVAYVDADSYQKINEGLEKGTIDAGFVCSGPYVDGKDAFGLELLAVPRAYGQNVYYSYLIVPKGSRAASLDDLRGKSFAFTDPLSNSGCLVPTYLLSTKGETPKSFFAKTIFTGNHDSSIQAVAEGVVDGASVDSLIWEYANRKTPEFTSRTKVILKSEPCGIPPVVVRPGLDPALKERIREVYLRAHEDPKGAALLSKMMIERFDPPDDRLYDSVREMKKRTTAAPGGKK
jgi:phosphonate transport system substrate-binding protein